MANAQIPVTTTLKTADDAASNSSMAMRDANGDLWAVNMRASAALRGSGLVLGNSPSKTSNFSADNTYKLWLVDTSSGIVTITLPSAAANPGLVLTFKKTNATANNMVITRAGSDTIDGANTKTSATQYAVMTIQSDGVSAWHVISSLQTFT